MHCELCVSRHPTELWRNEHFYVLHANDPMIPGFVRVVAVDHVSEMSDLTPHMRAELWELLNLVESVMRKEMQPKKVNLAEFGNMVPHLHWHVIPRYEDDPYFPGSVWSEVVRTVDPAVLEERHRKETCFLRVLTQELEQFKYSN
ncbi:MAG: HIT family protein [Duodenibacillus sp.]|nr:HIT family protein [Duodenibacillus sp.]